MTEVNMDELLENLAQCRRCGVCRDAVYEEMGFDGVCPVWRNSNGFETSFMRGRILVAQALLDGRLEKTEKNVESLFTCMLCGNCTEICGAEFDPVKCLEQVRQVLNDVPNKVRDSVSQKILEHQNPYNINGLKRDWVAEVGFDISAMGETLYYTGCTAGMKLPSIAKSTAAILRAANVTFSVLENEPCCGSVMLRTGAVESAERIAQNLQESILEAGAKRIVVSCAGCLRTLRYDYPGRFGVDLPNVIHIVEYAQQLIEKGQLKPPKTEDTTSVTYHDPCHLGRELRIFDAPREILRAMPGVELVEMETKRETAMCCGAGGGVRSYDSDLSKRIAVDRVRTATSSGAEILATACPFCVNNLKTGAKIIGDSIRVEDIVVLLAERL
ncbi:MAG: (Fe-S)-binding protein [Candidatus Hodarchaeota archaeon]